MKKLLFTLLLSLGLLGTTQAFAHDAHVYAVRFYADWCGNCKALDANLNQARSMTDLESGHTLFVVLNLTNDTTKHQAKMLADQLGIGDIYRANNGKTGQLVLINAATKQPLQTLSKSNTPEEITAAIMKAQGMIEHGTDKNIYDTMEEKS